MSHRRRGRTVLVSLALLGAGYVAAAYLIAPEFWKFRERGADAHPPEMLTRTSAGIAGDPINVGLIGDKAAVLRAFALAGWDTADAVTLKSAVEIGVSVLFDHPYPDAPVSPLFYEGREQDLAFEKPVGDSADQRHHVRFWRTPRAGPGGSELWLGSASFDRGVGLSHDTGQITHHIAPDIDAERDGLLRDLTAAEQVVSTYVMAGVGATRDGRNGGGDPYVTDGRAVVGVLKLQPHEGQQRAP